MLVPIGDFGRYGVVHDTMNSSLPIGAWSDARNIRFSGIQMEKMLEPEVFAALEAEGESDISGARWMEGWSDGLSTYVVVATQTRLFFYVQSGEGEAGEWRDVSRGDYSDQGVWDSFSWGGTVIFNNQVDPPQIFNPSTLLFEDLPNWGLISTADDISNGSPPSKQVAVSCTVLRPYKGFLVAGGITEGGEYQPNTVWWSDATNLAAFSTRVTNGGPPDWDYESPASLSGKAEVGIGDGAIQCAEMLNENLVFYNERSATSMQNVGGQLVMSFRRLFEKGAAGIHCVAEFNNQHFVLSRDQIYLHNGSAVKLIAKDRVEEEFFRRVGKGGRFGGNSVDWNAIQVVKNPDRKEIMINYGGFDPYVCKTYSETAFEDGLITLASAMWVLDDFQSNPTVKNYINDADFLGKFGNPQMGVAVTNNLDDGGRTAGKLSGNGSYNSFSDGATPSYVSSESGAVGGLFRTVSSNSNTLITVRINAKTQVRLEHSGGGALSFIIDSGSGQANSLTQAFSGVDIGTSDLRPYVMTWVLTESDVLVKLYGGNDFDLIDTIDATAVGGTWLMGVDSSRRFIIGGNGTGTAEGQYVWYRAGDPSAFDIDTIHDFYNQNKIGYTDPDPRCS